MKKVNERVGVDVLKAPAEGRELEEVNKTLRYRKSVRVS